MSYRRKAKQTYSLKVRRSLPSLNLAYRSAWQDGMKAALPHIEQLRTEGWNVDLERGAMTQSQADVFTSHAEKQGFETARIPVAEWLGDMAQFVAYKPKQAEVGEEATVPPIPQPKPEPKKATRVEKEFNPVERFQKMFWPRGKTPEEPDGGTLMGPDRTMAVVPHDADPSHSVTQLATGIVSKANVREPLDYDNLLKAEKAGKGKVKFGKEGYFSIDKVKRATRIIGKSEAYFDTGGAGVLAVKNQRGDIVLIAPIVEPSDAETVSIDIEELNRL